MDHLASAASVVPVFSSLPDLRGVPLKQMHSVSAAALSETLDRVLPSMAIPQVPVAAFNSTI
jgi:FXSXX-COOH protein